MSEASPRFGEPIELPWWVVVLALPPLLFTAVSLVIPTTLFIHAIAALPALALVWAIGRIATRVESQNMQSVWISLAYGLWAVFPITYVAVIISRR